MIDGQWRLIYPGVDYTFGTPGLPVFNHRTPEVGTPEIRTSDTDRPRADGRSFGVDYLGGQDISFDLGVRGNTDAEVRSHAAALRTIWRADEVRLTGGAVAELRSQYAGRERSVFGRPRRFSADYSDAAINHNVDALADFVCVDDLFYGPSDEVTEFGIVPALTGGLLAPLRSPLTTTRSSDRSQGMTVVSDLPVWPVVTLYGPISSAVIGIGDAVYWEVRLDLAYDEFVTIDTRPWARTALRNGTTNVSGRVRGTRLSRASLTPGTHEVSLRGVDPTGTARIRIERRPTFSSL